MIEKRMDTQRKEYPEQRELRRVMLSPEAHQKLKAYSALNDIRMGDVAAKIVEKWLERSTWHTKRKV